MTEVRVTMLFACLYAPVTSASSSLSSSSCFACFLFNWVGAGGARNLSCSFGFYFCDTSTGQIKCWHGSLYE